MRSNEILLAIGGPSTAGEGAGTRHTHAEHISHRVKGLSHLVSDWTLEIFIRQVRVRMSNIGLAVILYAQVGDKIIKCKRQDK